jgi:hypothetical protein
VLVTLVKNTLTLTLTEWTSRRLQDTDTILPLSVSSSAPSYFPSSSPSATPTLSIAGNDDGPPVEDDQFTSKNTASASQVSDRVRIKS